MVHRKDIEGLRALAVLIVVLSHLKIGAFTGGFVGVDIFFTISGFLITNIMLNEYATNYEKFKGYGFISIRAFYFRRAKRILPLSLFIIFTTLIMSFFLFNQVKFARIADDGFWSSMFLANYHFIEKGTDYFEHGFSISPLQHYWSLAVEEQFYLIFPFLFLIVTKFHGIRIRKKHINWKYRVLIISMLVTFIGFIYSLIQSYTNPVSAYFSSSSRGWQISLGSTLAIILNLKDKQKEKTKLNELLHPLSAFLLFFFSLKYINEHVKYPGYLAILPAAFTSVVLYSRGNNLIINKVIGNRIFEYIGSRSYSIYLIHWPLIILWNLGSSLVEIAKFFIALFCLSEFSFRFIETPFRSIKTPQSFYSKKPLRILISHQIKSISNLFLKFRWALLALAMSLFIFNFSRPNLQLTESTDLNEVTSVTSDTSSEIQKITSDSASYPILLADWKNHIKAGLALKKVPSDLDPPLSNILSERGKQWSACMNNTTENYCSFGNQTAPKKAIIVGDSYALAFYPTIIESLKGSDFQIFGLNMGQCMVANVVPFINGEPSLSCFEHRQKVFSFIKEIKPDLVFLSDFAGHEIANGNSQLLVGRDEFWANKLEESIKIVSENSQHFVYFGQPPGQSGITDCVDSRGNIGPSCIGHPSGNVRIRVIQRSLTNKFGGFFIDTDEWLCSLGACPPIIDNAPVFWDGNHLGNTFALKLAPLLRSYLHEKDLI